MAAGLSGMGGYLKLGIHPERVPDEAFDMTNEASAERTQIIIDQHGGDPYGADAKETPEQFREQLTMAQREDQRQLHEGVGQGPEDQIEAGPIQAH